MLCLFCQEEIIEGATKCKHCKTTIPPHFQILNSECPYCKEEIQPRAIKCKHCKSMLLDAQTPIMQP